MKAAVTYLLGETEGNERTSLGITDVTEDVNGIKQLIDCGSLRAAVNLTLRCLTTYGQGFGRSGQLTRHTPHSLQLWFTRFALLIKLGEYDLCKREAEAFSLLDRPDMFYDVSNYCHKCKRFQLNSQLHLLTSFLSVLSRCL